MRIYNRDSKTGKIKPGHTILSKQERDKKFFDFVAWPLLGKELECWEWLGSRDEKGYGRFHIGKHKYAKAHRYSLGIVEHLQQDLVVDHICMNKGCVNPKHLRQVTKTISSLENTRSRGALNKAKTHCKYGHKFDEQNTYRPDDRKRVCKTCRKSRYHYNQNRNTSRNA